MQLTKQFTKFRSRKRRGQALVEYANVLAFIAVLVATIFALHSGTLFAAISQAFNEMGTQLMNLAHAADSSSS